MRHASSFSMYIHIYIFIHIQTHLKSTLGKWVKNINDSSCTTHDFVQSNALYNENIPPTNAICNQQASSKKKMHGCDVGYFKKGKAL